MRRSLHVRSWRGIRQIWGWSALICAVLMLLGANPASAVATPEKVRDRKGVNELQPAMSEDGFVWSQGDNSFVKPEHDPRVRLNLAGSSSFFAAIDDSTVVYNVFENDQASLEMYDLRTGERSSPPAGVNTNRFEEEPSLSGDWLLFTRLGPRRTLVVLFNLDTSEQRVLENLRAKTHYVVSDQVNGDWATFETCDNDRGSLSDCQAYRYRISTREQAKIPNPGRQQYAAGITKDGTAYLISTGESDHWQCGAGATLVRQPVSGSRHVVATLPTGIDSFNTFAFEESDGSVTVLFDRIHCRNGSSGIYEVENADTA
jgi:hypothetical protein